MMRLSKLTIAALPVLINACAILPDGPTVVALPGTGLSLESFQSDDVNCQAFALGQINNTPNQATGSGPSRSWYSNQQRYDINYIQCMYAKGHRVPVNGQFSPNIHLAPTAPSSPIGNAIAIPPPPAGSPPPPPPK